MELPEDDPLARLHGRHAFFQAYEQYWRAQGNGDLPYVPRPSKVSIDLYTFFHGVQPYGGIDEVYNQRKFQPIAALLRLPITATSCGNILNKTYRTLILPCEDQIKAATTAAYRTLGMLKTVQPVKNEEHTGKPPRKRSKTEPANTLPELSAAATAVLESAMPVAEITDWEIEEYPEHKDTPDLYLDIRNHLLHRWHQDYTRRLQLQMVLSEIPASYHPLAARIHHTLQRRGLINFGVLPFESVSTSNQQNHIVVVGGGISGLGAARQLRSLGFRVTVVEAKQRLGGRCHSDWDTFGGPVDLGAMLITGMIRNPIAVLCQQLNLELSVLHPENCPIRDITGQVVAASIDQPIEKHFNNVLEIVNKQRKKIRDKNMSLGELFHKTLASQPIKSKHPIKSEPSANGTEDSSIVDRLLRWHTANLEYGCAAELNKVSLLHWDQDDPHAFDGDHFLVCSGYGAMIDGLARGMEDSVRLGHEVQCIHYRPKGVTVDIAGTDPIQCDAVLVTSSLGVLKDGWMKFEPALPAWKQHAIDRMGFGTLNKVALEFESTFWDTSADYFGNTQSDDAARGEYFLFWNMAKAYKKSMLLALVAGEAAVALEQKDDDVIVAAAMQVLRRNYPDAPDPKKFAVTRWVGDRHIRGCYSYIATGATGEDYDSLARPVADRVFFAGEHTCRNHPTTAAGSYISGLREADRIARLFGTQ